MGNQSCVVDGANPHSMGYFLINNSSKQLILSEENCQCDEHRGFSANHGKFKMGWQPKQVIRAGDYSKCWMSGREGSAVNPAGWIKYNIEGGGELRIDFESAGWTDLQDRAFVQVSISNCSSLKVSATKKNIESVMGSGFKGTDLHRQFEIVVSNNTVNGQRSATAGRAAENRLLPKIEYIPGAGLLVAGYHGIQGDNEAAKRCAVKGAIGLGAGLIGGVVVGAFAQAIVGEAAGNAVMEISGPRSMSGSVLITDLSTVPSFPTYLHADALRHAMDENNGKVKIGGPCAGVAIQRVWWLKHDRIASTSVWPRPKAPCIASHLSDWLRKDGFKTEDLGISKTAIYKALRDGKVVLCVIRNQHWVTVIGVQDEMVFVIDYDGLYTVPLFEFSKHVCNVNIVAPTAAIAVYI